MDCLVHYGTQRNIIMLHLVVSVMGGRGGVSARGRKSGGGGAPGGGGGREGTHGWFQKWIIITCSHPVFLDVIHKCNKAQIIP